MTDIQCRRCAVKRPRMISPPFPDELGQQIHREICQVCWGEWLQRQMQLINHYALDVRMPEARDFLRRNLQAFLFDEGKADEIDTSQRGDVT